jgi:glutaredoxin 3
MAKVVIYTTRNCPYCQQAKALLGQKGVAYEEINLDGKPEERAQLVERTKLRTVPQIFINDELVGGFTELMALETARKLDAKLGKVE